MSHAAQRDEYNYSEFTREWVEGWLSWDTSPPIGRPAPDYPLWELDGTETRLSDVWSLHTYTVVEFGSFT